MDHIFLEKGDFFELVASVRLLEVLQLEAQQKAGQIAVAKAKGSAIMAALREKHTIPEGDLAFDETTCALIPRGKP